MKLKEQYHRILTAKRQWQEFNNLNEYIKPSVCTEKLEKYLLSKYKDWEITVNSHCCYGWEKCCWQDLFAEGVWDLTEEEVAEYLKSILKKIRKLSSQKPVFYIKEHDDVVDILVTYRYKNVYEGNVDYEIIGFNKNKR